MVGCEIVDVLLFRLAYTGTSLELQRHSIGGLRQSLMDAPRELDVVSHERLRASRCRRNTVSRSDAGP